MKISSLIYSIKQGLTNIRRNKMFSLASAGTIMACLFLFGIFYFLLYNFQHMIKTAETSVGVTVFFEEDISEDKVREIGEKLRARPEVKEIRFVSAEDAWKKFKKDYFKNAKELANTFGEDNPLVNSSSYEIYLNDISLQKSLVRYVKEIDGIRQVNNSDTAAKSLKSFNILVGYISAAIIIILLAVAVFLISTTVTMGIAVRKEEIAIMKLIGATDFFIRAPFIVEGMVIGLIGAVIPLIILYLIYNRAIVYIAAKFNILSDVLVFVSAKTIFSSLMPLCLVLGVGIGLLGSLVTVRKHLRV